MIFLGIIVITLTIIGVMAWMSPESDEPKNTRKSKKNFFVRLGESGNPKYNWMGGYTESD